MRKKERKIRSQEREEFIMKVFPGGIYRARFRRSMAEISKETCFL